MSTEPFYNGRLAILQRVLPAYRVVFFEQLAGACSGGLSIYAGQPQPEEQIVAATEIPNAQLFPGRNRQLFPIGSPFYQCWQMGLLNWLSEWDPDALIVEANPRYPKTLEAVRWMRSKNRPVLGWGLGAPVISGLFAGMRSKTRLRFLETLDGMIAYSRRGAQEYRAIGFPAERVCVSINAAAARPDAPLIERPEYYCGCPIVLFVGRLQRRKRLDLLFQACANLPGDLQPCLWIVGEGPARADLVAQAARTYPKAEFLGGLFGSDLEARFIRADLFVLPGTGGLAIQQAMSFGLPVIAAQGDGTQADLVRPENGWNISPGDLHALTSSLRKRWKILLSLDAWGQNPTASCAKKQT